VILIFFHEARIKNRSNIDRNSNCNDYEKKRFTIYSSRYD